VNVATVRLKMFGLGSFEIAAAIAACSFERPDYYAL